MGLNNPDKQKFSSPLFTTCYSLGKYSNKEPKALPRHVTSQCSQLQPATEPAACAVWWYSRSASVFVVEYSALFLAISKVCNLSSQAWTLDCVKWRNVWHCEVGRFSPLFANPCSKAHQPLERHVFLSLLSIIMICDCNVFYDVRWTSRQVFNEAQSLFYLTNSFLDRAISSDRRVQRE